MNSSSRQQRITAQAFVLKGRSCCSAEHDAALSPPFFMSYEMFCKAVSDGQKNDIPTRLKAAARLHGNRIALCAPSRLLKKWKRIYSAWFFKDQSAKPQLTSKPSIESTIIWYLLQVSALNLTETR